MGNNHQMCISSRHPPQSRNKWACKFWILIWNFMELWNKFQTLHIFVGLIIRGLRNYIACGYNISNRICSSNDFDYYQNIHAKCFQVIEFANPSLNLPLDIIPVCYLTVPVVMCYSSVITWTHEAFGIAVSYVNAALCQYKQKLNCFQPIDCALVHESLRTKKRKKKLQHICFLVAFGLNIIFYYFILFYLNLYMVSYIFKRCKHVMIFCWVISTT